MLDIIRRILQWFRKKPAVEPETIKPTSTTEIDLTELWRTLRDKFPKLANPDTEFYLSDAGNYLLPTSNDIALFLAQDQTNKYPYIVEKFDCDDFAYRLMGQFSIPEWSALCFGIVWTTTHALNCVIDEDKNFWFVEPQTDELMSELKSWMGEVRFLMI